MTCHPVPLPQRAPNAARPDRRRLLGATVAGTFAAPLGASFAGLAPPMPVHAATAGRPADLPHDPAPRRRASAGAVVPIGGALRDDNDGVWSRLVAAAGGAGARFEILAAASGDPAAAAAAAAANLERHGARCAVLPVGAGLGGGDAARAAQDPALAERVRAADGLFMTGGAQARLLAALLPGGQPAPLLQALREAQRAGLVVAGTSAGAAVLSAWAFIEAPDPLAVMQGRLRRDTEYGAGLALAPAGWVVDQHFLRRGRLARLLPLMVAERQPWGIGVEEGSAALFQADGRLEVVGTRGSLVADLRDARPGPAGAPFTLTGARLSFVDVGDTLDTATGRIAPGPRKREIDFRRPGFRGYFEGYRRVWPDLLGDNAVLHAMARLVDSSDAEVRGLVFDPAPPAGDPTAALGFEWRLYKRPETRAWSGAAGDDVSAEAVGLDLRPVRIAQPLLRDWETAAPR